MAQIPTKLWTSRSFFYQFDREFETYHFTFFVQWYHSDWENFYSPFWPDWRCRWKLSDGNDLYELWENSEDDACIDQDHEKKIMIEKKKEWENELPTTDISLSKENKHSTCSIKFSIKSIKCCERNTNKLKLR